METLQQLKERKQELENELSTYKWWGNEEDEEYKEEYGREYEHLDNELHNIRMQIFELNKKII
jgi:beta-mannanase